MAGQGNKDNQSSVTNVIDDYEENNEDRGLGIDGVQVNDPGSDVESRVNVALAPEEQGGNPMVVTESQTSVLVNDSDIGTGVQMNHVENQVNNSHVQSDTEDELDEEIEAGELVRAIPDALSGMEVNHVDYQVNDSDECDREVGDVNGPPLQYVVVSVESVRGINDEL